ncbi:MAG: branched-chain amino acid aminotransferase [Coriobacteriales bacterium]|nr:branched-chain amino acid aminotransferase [Coriobacteriales bacterium]
MNENFNVGDYEIKPVSSANLDWENLPFDYVETDYSLVANYSDGKWQNACMTKDHTITLNECANIFQYCQEVFEGAKAFCQKDGTVACFRPWAGAQRMYYSAARLCMPQIDIPAYVYFIDEVVKANLSYVPPYGSGAALYLRPFMIGTGKTIGVKPASSYQFRIITTPVGPYFKGGEVSIKCRVADFDRAAPRGTGAIKAGLNYAMSLFPYMQAKEEGYAENFFLDPKTNTFVDETGGANILFVSKSGTLVVPKSLTNSILNSITRRSIVRIAEEICGMTVVERVVSLDEILDESFVECGLCGTAAVVSPVSTVHANGMDIEFPNSQNGCGPVLGELRSILREIQLGEREDPFDWIDKIY